MSAAARAAWRGWEDWREVERRGKVSFAKEEGKKKKEKERKNALWEKKSPRARPLVNDLRVKPTAAAAQAAAASAPREPARVDVDVGQREGGSARACCAGRWVGRRRERGGELRTEQGEAPPALLPPRPRSCGLLPSPLPLPPCSLLGGWGVIGVTSQGEACCLLTDRFFFFSPLFSLTGLVCSGRKRRFPHLLPPHASTPTPAPPS